MKKQSEYSQNLPFYLFAAGVYLLIVCQDVFSNGMFFDGLVYSTVSRNLANGLGTFWNPHFTATCLSDFHEHPPLAFGIQSIFYKVLGESRFVDKFYSLITLIITGLVILRIWKTLGYKYGWLPLFLWLITPTVFWESYNNLLENSLTVFTSLSILFYLKNLESKKYYFIFLSGFMISLGFLTKGFVAFFPWTFPFLFWLVLKKKSFGQMAMDSTGIIVFSVLPLLLLILFSPVASLSLHKYFDNQVVYSLKNAVTVDSRFYILNRMLSDIAPIAGLCLVYTVWSLIAKSSPKLSLQNSKKALLFTLLGLTGVLPVMISLKQSGFYIIPVYPFFAVAAAIIIYPFIDNQMVKMNYQSKGFRLFRLAGFGIFLAGLILSIYFSDHFSRDRDKIKDTYTLIEEIPQGSTINILPVMYSDWSLHAYWARLKNISLDPVLGNKREYLLIKNENFSDTLNSGYENIKLNTIEYQLFKRK